MTEVTIPRMLADLIGGSRTVEVTGDTVGEALDGLFAKHPALRVHLIDEDGRLREHLRCFRNDRATRLDEPIADGDRLTVLQAVSGGADAKPGAR